MRQKEANTGSPLDFASLISWLEHLTNQYSNSSVELDPSLQRGVDTVRNLRAVLLEPPPPRESVNYVRQLLALGILRYQRPQQVEQGSFAPLVVYSVASAALWPLVVVRKMTKSWEPALQKITSPAILDLVVFARMNVNHLSREDVSLQLTQGLQRPRCYQGILRLFEDICDPERGGSVLVSLITIRDGSPPDKVSDLTSLLHFLFGATVGGIVGNTAYDLVTQSVKHFLESMNTTTGGGGPIPTPQLTELPHDVPTPPLPVDTMPVVDATGPHESVQVRKVHEREVAAQYYLGVCYYYQKEYSHCIRHLTECVSDKDWMVSKEMVFNTYYYRGLAYKEFGFNSMNDKDYRKGIKNAVDDFNKALEVETVGMERNILMQRLALQQLSILETHK